MAKLKAVGIDLGTTHSAVAWINASGRSTMIRNAEGDLLTPSIVLFEDNEVIIGKEARSALVVHPDEVAQFVKRDMGSPVYNHPIRGEFLPPEVIQACILRKLNEDIVRTLGTDARVVITVPAYFDEPRRKSTADAGEMAGLNVLDIVNEPTAAALAFVEILNDQEDTADTPDELTVLVFDLGGGTFDATVLRIAPGDVRTLATDGDVQLGGHDWDLRLVNYIADQFEKTHGADTRKDLGAFNRLYSAALEAKHALSARSRAKVYLEHEGLSGEIPVTREQFEELTGDLLERTAYTTRQLIAAADLQWTDLDRILLVGGSTRMPMIADMLLKMSNIKPDHTVNPDEAVARGAAIYASYLMGAESEGGLSDDYQITNVNSHSLGIEGIDPETMRKRNIVLISRNTPLPATLTEKFSTKTDNQRSIVVQVLEGESAQPGECTAIGRTVVRNLPDGLPKGWPIEVTFQYAANGRLSIEAVVPGTERQVNLDIERNVGLSDKGLTGWKRAVKTAANEGFDAFDDMLDSVLEEAETTPRATATPPGNPSTMMKPDSAPASAYNEPEPSEKSPMSTGAENPQPPPLYDSMPDTSTDHSTQRLVINFVGFLLSAVLGLAAGYLIVMKFFPETNLPKLW